MTILCNDWECVFNREGICTYELYMRAFHGAAFRIDEGGKCLRRTHKEEEKEEKEKEKEEKNGKS